MYIFYTTLINHMKDRHTQINIANTNTANTKNRPPVIGITLDLATNDGKYSFASKPWYALRRSYSDIVSEYGAIAIFLPYSNDIESIISLIDGLIISGGDKDINPKFYGGSAPQKLLDSGVVKYNDERADFELRLLDAAFKEKMPVLGICNGLQIMNSYFGGNLIHHIPDAIKSDINHEQPEPKDAPSHEIIIEDGSVLSRFSNNKTVMVNSTHHQAIDKIGRGLVVSARAPDNIIEAIEIPDHKFFIGVEWHPEHLNSELDRNLFKNLIAASKNSM